MSHDKKMSAQGGSPRGRNPVVHFEMSAEDRKRMSEFYTKVFGWKTQQLGAEMGDYVLVQTTETDKDGMVKTPGTINGGFYQRKKDSVEPHLVIAVDDLDEHMAMVKKEGGTIAGEPMVIQGIGRFVMIKDTEGNKVGMLQPKNM